MCPAEEAVVKFADLGGHTPHPEAPSHHRFQPPGIGLVHARGDDLSSGGQPENGPAHLILPHGAHDGLQFHQVKAGAALGDIRDTRRGRSQLVRLQSFQT